MEVFSLSEIAAMVANVVSGITDNIGAILLVVGAIVGISFVMAWLDIRSERKYLENYSKRWER